MFRNCLLPDSMLQVFEEVFSTLAVTQGLVFDIEHDVKSRYRRTLDSCGFHVTDNIDI